MNKKKKHEKAAFSSRIVHVIQTLCVGINITVTVKKIENCSLKSTKPFANSRAVVILNNSIPGFCLPVSSALRPDSSRRF